MAKKWDGQLSVFTAGKSVARLIKRVRLDGHAVFVAEKVSDTKDGCKGKRGFAQNEPTDSKPDLGL